MTAATTVRRRLSRRHPLPPVLGSRRGLPFRGLSGSKHSGTAG